MTTPSKTSLKQYQEALTALEGHHNLTTQAASLRAERFDLGQRLSLLLRQGRDLRDALVGYQSNRERYAAEIAETEADIDRIDEEINAITQEDTRTAAALLDTERQLIAPPAEVNPAALKAHRDLLTAERIKLTKLEEHRDRIASDGGGDNLAQIEVEWQDMLAKQAVGEEVGERLAEVSAQLAQRQAAQAAQEASTRSTLSGLDRMIRDTEASLATLERQQQGLAALFWRVNIGKANEEYERLAFETASALERIQAMVTILGEHAPTAQSGLNLSGLSSSRLPSLLGIGDYLLAYESHLAPGCDRQADCVTRLKALEGHANE